MKPFRIGLLTHSFHRRSAAGLRCWHLGRALAREGADLRVYCTEGETPSDLGEASCAVREIGVVPRGFADRADTLARVLHARFGWTPPLVVTFHAKLRRRAPILRAAFDAVRRAEERRPHDFLLAVWPDFEWADAARSVARVYRMPFAVEFQDPWMHFYPPGVRPHALGALRRVLDGAAFTLNVCEAWCARDTRDFGLRSVCIPTGFWERPRPSRDGDPRRSLRLAYAGSLWYFDLAPLVKGLRLARDAGVDWRFAYAGDDEALVRGAFEAEGIADQLETRGRVTPEDALDAISAADALPLFTLPSKPSTFGFKFAEVVSRGLPVLLIGPDDPVLREAIAARARLHACPDAAAVAAALAELARARPIRPQPHPSVAEWTWPALARRLLGEMRVAAFDRKKA
ncbi:MAG: hypothetical protein IT578_03135 [Verrucomicrobiae bacterium]|nr:hypothetical protein [Verrucomicrobiae bacterium]